MPSSPFADFMKAQGKNPLELLPEQVRQRFTQPRLKAPKQPTFNINDPRLKAFMKFMMQSRNNAG